jgi:hypothetical protein
LLEFESEDDDDVRKNHFDKIGERFARSRGLSIGNSHVFIQEKVDT